MYKLLGEAVETALALKSLVANANHCEVVIAPVFTAIKTVADRLEGSNVRVAAQNCSSETKHSADTGEICADMLKDVGASHVIIGHSERRQFYGESDNSVNAKTKASLAFGLIPIVCVGEILAERESGNAKNVVKSQIVKGLEGLTTSDMERIIIAYEPVWAIGTGKTADARTGSRNARFYTPSFRRNARKRSSSIDANSLRRIGKTRKHQGIDESGRRRWCIGRRSKFGSGKLCQNS